MSLIRQPNKRCIPEKLTTCITAFSVVPAFLLSHDSVMHQAKNGGQWHHGMKAYFSDNAASGLVHTLTGTVANAHSITQAFCHRKTHYRELDNQ